LGKFGCAADVLEVVVITELGFATLFDQFFEDALLVGDCGYHAAS
jgi:hypothetical protein